ncbi:DNA polymerase III subunit alpha [Mycoplasma corogypsi]|uniref:DNA polymerase III subunit alpha n=1 Tax=Mycoplasma corogypsi TaxID=2106 RepID=UPI003873A920
MRKNIILHTNTEYSFLYSTIRLQKLFELAKENNLEYLTLTDVDNMYALQYYYEQAKNTGIKLILGIETKVILDQNSYFKVIVIAKNNLGLEFIYKLINNASRGVYATKLEDLANENVFVIDHKEKGLVAKGIKIASYSKNFYFNSDKEIAPNTVFAPTKRVLFENENEIINVLENISGNVNDNVVFKDYFETESIEKIDLKVYQNMLELVESISYVIPDSTLKLASFSEDNEKLLLKLITENEKVEYLITHHGKETVLERIKYEFGVIKKLGFIDYFLIIWDAIRFARQNGIEVGPGRGSASGSLISYLLDITRVNPLEFGLLFERFLNVDRVSLPDIDIDIQDNRREELLRYIQTKYGADKVALISTFQTLAAKSAIKDVARFLKISPSEANAITATLGVNDKDKNLDYYYKNNKRYQVAVSKYENLHRYASMIEGLPRQSGLHAAGIIITNETLNKSFPTAYNQNGFEQIQFTLDYLERYGLVKMDFLGLKNLTIIQQIEALIDQKEHFDTVVNNNYSRFVDQETLKLLNKKLTNGIFQIESTGMQDAIQKVHIDSFDDLYAIISLYRPGPMQYIGQYAENKRDFTKIYSIEPKYDKIVKPTFGIIVYQEQIMEIAQQVAGMSFSQADLLRKAISKKDEQKLHSYKQSFFDGGIKNGISQLVLEQIYNNIETFASYGFNKSHAVAYALISYKMAYYKARFPREFYKVYLSNIIGDFGNVNKCIMEANQLNIKINSPLIEVSSNVVEIVNKQLYLPINMIKGIGDAAVSKILAEKAKNGKFTDFKFTIWRLMLAGVTDSIIDTLIKAGVFRNFANVETLLASVGDLANIYKLFDSKNKKDKSNQNNDYQALLDFIKGNNYEQIPLIYRDKNIQAEMDYETALLGNIYNSIQIKTSDTTVVRPKLNELKSELVWVLAYLTHAKMAVNGKSVVISLKDETAGVTCYGFDEKTKQLHINNKPRLILVYMMKNDKGYYNIKDWREYEN